jgi:hypothetical protein
MERFTGHIHSSEYGRWTRQLVQLRLGMTSRHGPSSRATTLELVRRPVRSEKNERSTALGTSRPSERQDRTPTFGRVFNQGCGFGVTAKCQQPHHAETRTQARGYEPKRRKTSRRETG